MNTIEEEARTAKRTGSDSHKAQEAKVVRLDGQPVDPQAQPIIQVNERSLPEVTADALAALEGANSPPRIFRRGNVLTRIAVGDEITHLEALGQKALRHHLARVAVWAKVAHRRDGDVLIAIAPPYDVVDDILHAPAGTWRFPPIERVVSAPVFAADGAIESVPGYHEGSRTWYEPYELIVPAVPENPTLEQVDAAVRLLSEELLGDFPFVSNADRAHALALAITPFVRTVIDGSVPLFLIEAPTPGTGKGLLAAAALIASVGAEPPCSPEGDSDAEWRKTLFAALIQAPPVVLFDNVRHPLDSAALASALTSANFEDRILGESRRVTLSVRTVFVATANNPILSSEIVRRTVRIRLDSELERPNLRTEFRHPELLPWAKEHRGELVGAIHTIVRAWLVLGRPKGEIIVGSYESWARVLGGILAVAGVEGLLTNLDEFYRDADTESGRLHALIEAWWDVFGDRSVTVSELLETAEHAGVDLGDGNERSRQIRLGKLLRANRDRVIATVRIRAAGKYSGSSRWRLEHYRPDDEL